MDKVLKEKWVQALRSGKYKQGKGSLRKKNDCYCCIGVLCDVSEQGNWKEPSEKFKDQEVVDFFSWCTLAEPSAESVGSINYAEEVKWGIGGGHLGELIHMNDFGNKTFSEIADYIEQNM